MIEKIIGDSKELIQKYVSERLTGNITLELNFFKGGLAGWSLNKYESFKKILNDTK